MNSVTEASLFKGFTILEIIINISTYIILGICFHIFIKYPMFHTNFIRLIKCIAFYFLVSQFMRLIIAVNELMEQNSLNFDNVSKNYLLISGTGVFTTLGTIRLFCLTAFYATTGTVALERIYATVKLKTYEKTVSSYLFALCFGYQMMLSSIATYGIYSDLISTLAAGIFVVVGTIFICIVLWGLKIFNKRRHLTSLLNPQRYSLSERFQLNENIKTARIIGRVAQVIFALNCLLGAFICVSYYYETNLIRRCAYTLLQICLSLYGYSFGIAGMSAEALWYHHFTKICLSLARARIKPIEQSEAQQRLSLSKQLLTHNGKKMVFTIDEEREFYFKELNNRWNK